MKELIELRVELEMKYCKPNNLFTALLTLLILYTLMWDFLLALLGTTFLQTLNNKLGQ